MASLKEMKTPRKKAEYEALQKRRKQFPEDVLLHYNVLDKGLQSIKSAFKVPQTLWRGLKGSSDFTFADTMLVSKVPYYLGGVVLALSPVLGGNRKEGVRQATAVVLYLLGNMASHHFINALYRWRYGIDLSMLYRSKSGNIEQVFASRSFPRFDLLKPTHFEKIARKMKIPESVYDRDGAVKDNIRHIIASSRVLKLIVATITSAVCAGFIARTDQWTAVSSAMPTFTAIWRSSNIKYVSKLGAMASTLLEALRKPLLDRLTLPVLLGGLVIGVLSLLHVLFGGMPRHQYAAGKTNTQHEFNRQYADLIRQNRQPLYQAQLVQALGGQPS